jgi:hypothetical protein
MHPYWYCASRSMLMCSSDGIGSLGCVLCCFDGLCCVLCVGLRLTLLCTHKIALAYGCLPPPSYSLSAVFPTFWWITTLMADFFFSGPLRALLFLRALGPPYLAAFCSVSSLLTFLFFQACF